jgi:hypothetical protein
MVIHYMFVSALVFQVLGVSSDISQYQIPF